MSEIIRQWIQEKLGIIIKLSPDNFCELTRDGYLLCRILKSYEIINGDQLLMIERSNVRSVCLKNFEEHILDWLKVINIELSSEEVANIVDCQGLSSVSLFYRVFLELHEKDCLNFISKTRQNEKLRPPVSKFTVQQVKERSPGKVSDTKFRDYIENTQDVIHWLQDRLEMVVTRCKIARQEYLNILRTSDRTITNSFSVPDTIHESEESFDHSENSSTSTLDMSYADLINEKNEVLKKKEFKPNYLESQKILSKLKEKLKHKAENEVFMKELQKHSIKHFWGNISAQENYEFNIDIAQKVLKQSLFEKQMQTKIREIKYQRDDMLKSKKIINDRISKQKENDFMKKIMEKSEQITKDDFQYYLEKERAMQLHKAIYKEKIKLKVERTYNLCQNAIEGIRGMAMKFSEYKEYFGEEPSERIVDSWRKMVGGRNDFEEPRVPIEDLITSQPTAVEDIVQDEMKKQNEMDEKDFDSYISFEWPWILHNVPEDHIKEMNNGANILGRIVHILLNIKYPLPELPTPPDLQELKFMVCVNGLPDLSCLQLLQKLLNHKGILVVELQDCINFCINAYKQEGIEERADMDENEVNLFSYKETSDTLLKKGKKNRMSNVIIPSDGALTEIIKEDKCNQTPKLYPDEKLQYSQPAVLGEIAYEEISLGNCLTDFLLVSMFIEYIKVHQNNIQGWVLINYPTTFEQAVLFEEALSGLKVPGIREESKIFKSLTDIVFMCTEQQKHDSEDHRRFSKLLGNPQDNNENTLPYDTVLTAFVNILKGVRQSALGFMGTHRYAEISSEQCNNFEEKCFANEARSRICSHAVPSLRIMTMNETDDYDIPKEPQDLQETSKLKTFYDDQGCNYTVYYQDFDFFTVKHIAKLIIGDFSLPPKSSIELFGDTIKFLDPEKEDIKSVSSVKHAEKKEPERYEKVTKSGMPPLAGSEKSLQPKKDKNSTVIIHEDKSTQIPEVIIIEIEEQEPAKAGEEGWDYNGLEIPKEIGLVLVEIWENLEEIYINDIQQIFFQKRVFLNGLMPYVNFVKNFINKFIMKPDQRQLYIAKFQETFNNFDNDFRRDKEFKAELHCLINEMKIRLLDTIDIRMMRTESHRQDCIKTNWCPKQIIEIANNCLNGFQIELDRFCDTLTFINDYFTGLITQVPCEDVFQKEIIPKFGMDNAEIENEVNTILFFVETPVINPMIRRVEHLYYKAIGFVEKSESVAFLNYDRFRSMFSHGNGNTSRGKINVKPKLSGGKAGMHNIFEPSEKVKQNAQSILEAWTCTLKGELARIKIRLKLLRQDLTENTDLVLNTLKNTFHSLYEENRLKYEREVEMINKVAYILSLAVEKEVAVPEELILADDQFFIDPEHILFPDPPEVPPPPPDGLVFSINQLKVLIDILFDLAPKGYLPERTFTFLLQDMVFNNDKNMSPKEWTKLSGPNISQLIKEIFGTQEKINWKDFIIYNLVLPFPTIKQIIEMRNQFIIFDQEQTELIKLEDSKMVKFWFEGEELIKMLFRLYKVNSDYCNYSTLLLDFCKSDNLLVGLAKALALITGKSFCWDKSVGDGFVNSVLEERLLHEEQVRERDKEQQENLEFATTIVDSLIDKTVHACDSVIITEIVDEEQEKIDEKIDETQDKEKPLISETDQPLIDENEETKEENHDNLEEIPEEESTKFDSVQSAGKEGPESIPLVEVSVGYEAKKFPSFEYFLNIEDVITVLCRTFNWNCDADKLGENKVFFERLSAIYESCKNTNFNNSVLSHEFLNNEKFLKLLEETSEITRFFIKRPYMIVENLLIGLQIKEW